MRYYTSVTACQLAGLKRSALKHCLARSLMVVPAIKGKGRGHRDLWSEPQVFALVMMVNLRRRGVDAKSAVRAYHYLSALGKDELLSRFAAGRRYLAIIGGEFVPRMVGMGALENPDFSVEKAASYGISTVVIDVEAGWDQFAGSIQDQEVSANWHAKVCEKEPA
jgi:hypothetical protein